MSPLAATAPALRLRSATLQHIRAFFLDRGFLEVDTPLLLDAVPAEAASRPFPVLLHRGTRPHPRFLPPSPETGLKRLLPRLAQDLFEIGHAFRDEEEEGRQHRAHFRLLEWYRPGRTWQAVLDDAGELMAALGAFFADQALPSPLPSWEMERVTVSEAFARVFSFPLDEPAALDELPALARRRGHGDCDGWEEAFHLLMGLEVQPTLGRERPTALTHYPAGVAVQARPVPERPWFAEQFELYVSGVELMNCYTELTDPALLRERFAAESAEARAKGFELPWSEALVQTLTSLPEPTAGGCLGIDRLLMLALGVSDIDEVRP